MYLKVHKKWHLDIDIGIKKKHLDTVPRYVNLYLVRVSKYLYLGTAQHWSRKRCQLHVEATVDVVITFRSI